MTVVAAERLSKWYGHVLGVSDVSWSLGGGVVGLLGPNGAGKSTLMKLMTGLLRPSRGTIRVLGGDPFAEPAVRRRIGYSPEHESTYDELTARELVTVLAHLAGVPRKDAPRAAEAALDAMGMTDAMDRRVRGFSKGMRQRTKLAATLAHDPDLLILDEPLTGVDPVARIDIIERIKRLASERGKTVIVSSHVLYEIEALTEDIVVIYRGQVLAEGNIYEIRRLIDRHPHRIRIECDRPREVAAAVAGAEHVARLVMERRALVIETRDPDRCYDDLAAAILEGGIELRAMTSPDNNLGAVFEYLTGGRGAGGFEE
ncbi:MAG: ABC transporter ATP-binding protein [Deltaproteobacteria bacterium]|nr:ABC transporter ATP-binding protein [Kofleriaceae bacterium]